VAIWFKLEFAPPGLPRIVNGPNEVDVSVVVVEVASEPFMYKA
jgi:hypothetical protein